MRPRRRRATRRNGRARGAARPSLPRPQQGGGGGGFLQNAASTAAGVAGGVAIGNLLGGLFSGHSGGGGLFGGGSNAGLFGGGQPGGNETVNIFESDPGRDDPGQFDPSMPDDAGFLDNSSFDDGSGGGYRRRVSRRARRVAPNWEASGRGGRYVE